MNMSLLRPKTQSSTKPVNKMDIYQRSLQMQCSAVQSQLFFLVLSLKMLGAAVYMPMNMYVRKANALLALYIYPIALPIRAAFLHFLRFASREEKEKREMKERKKAKKEREKKGKPPSKGVGIIQRR